MKFKVLYIMAIIRGKFPPKFEYEIYANRITEDEVKKLYKDSGWEPHRVTNEGVGFIRPKCSIIKKIINSFTQPF